MASLSVIVPVYNKVRYLDACINSILGQTYKDLELILVDDGSSDGSSEKCDYYKTIDSRIIVIHKPNGGVSSARNAGIEIAGGKYIGFVDSDDTIEPQMYELLVRNLSDTGSDISVCGIKKTYKGKDTIPNNNSTIITYNREEGLHAAVTVVFDMKADNKLFRSELVKNIRFKGRFKEDFLFVIKAFFDARKSVFQDIPLYNYILRDDSVSVRKFSDLDMEGLGVDEEIINIFKSNNIPGIEEAEINFFVQNISTLNLILLESREKFKVDYKIIVDNLDRYSYLLKSSAMRRKHKIAYQLFRISPVLYALFLRLYIILIPSEVGRRE